MQSGGKRGRRRRRAKPGVAAFRSPLTAIVAALALLFQLAVIPYHQALSAPIAAPAAVDVAAVAAELHATFGDAAALCVETDGKGAPLAPAGDCDDHCPLCHFAAQAAALVAPDLPPLPGAPRRGLPDARRRARGRRRSRSVPTSRNRARAPPFAV